MYAAPPPLPGAPIPRQPAALAAKLDSTLRDLNAAVDRWQGLTARPPADVTLEALYEQRISILLSEKPRLATAVFRRVLAARQVRRDVVARRELRRLSRPRPLRAFETGPAAPAYRLRGFYTEAQRRFRVGWHVLAAVNYVESAFNKLRNSSTAGAQGPMQFLPSTWRAYGLGGNVHDPHDAILGAANYLHAAGAPGRYQRALYAYNPSQAYVDGVLHYAHRMRVDPRAFLEYYAWQVFVRTPCGLRRLTGPGL